MAYSTTLRSVCQALFSISFAFPGVVRKAAVSLLKKIWRQIDLALLGSTWVLIGLICQILQYVFAPDYPVPMWVVMILLNAFYLCSVVIYAVCKSQAVTVRYQYQPPRIRRGVRQENGKITLIVERNELFSDASFVTVYKAGNETELELPLAIGLVQYTSSPAFMQIYIVQMINTEQFTAIFTGAL